MTLETVELTVAALRRLFHYRCLMTTQYLQLLNVFMSEVFVLRMFRWRHKSPQLLCVSQGFLILLQLFVTFHSEEDGTQFDLSQLHLVLLSLAGTQGLVIGV